MGHRSRFTAASASATLALLAAACCALLAAAAPAAGAVGPLEQVPTVRHGELAWDSSTAVVVCLQHP
jgi:ABC-type proline/glycine betaine transport system substrate-binding protein